MPRMGAVVALVLLLAQPAPPSVSGRVLERETGRPLPRMLVRLVSSSPPREFEMLTGEDGTFTFRDIPAGRYAVVAGPNEHRVSHLRQWFGEAEPANVYGPPPRHPIELAAGEARTGIEIGLTRALAIEGRVTTGAGEPLANIELAATRTDGRGGSLWPVYSDERGEYRLYGLAPGRYRVCARIQGRGDGAELMPLVPTCYPAAVSETGAADVTLATADITSVDIAVQRTGGRSIAGTVLDAAGNPAHGARITATALREDSGGGGYAVASNGAFSLRGLMPEKYIVRAALGGSDPGDPNPARRELEVGVAQADLTALEAASVSIVMTKGQRVAGRIKFDASDAPRRDLRLVVGTFVADRSGMSELRPPTASVSNMAFELDAVFHREMRVSIQGLPQDVAIKSIRLGDRDITYMPVDLASGGALEIVLTDRPARPSIRVTDDDGTSRTAFTVVALPADPAAWAAGPLFAPDGPSRESVVTFPALPAGTYLFAALETADAVLLLRDRERVAQFAGIATRVTLTERDTRTIDLRVVALPPKR
jgi:hypothetical protein